MKHDVIAICGYIGSGKSTVARILGEWGYETVDCDILARRAADDPTLQAKVAELLGEEYVNDGQLDRRAIRERVFSDGELLCRYEALFFGEVRARLTDMAANSDNVLFAEIPVLDAFPFEWTEIWRVECSREQSLSRVTERDGVSTADTEAVLSRQRRYDATRVIRNDGSVDQLRRAVRKALDAYEASRGK